MPKSQEDTMTGPTDLIPATVQIPPHVTAARLPQPIPGALGGNTVEPTAANALAAARDNVSNRLLTAEQRQTFSLLSNHHPVAASDLVDAIIAAQGSNATRFGQSMTRRMHTAALANLWGWLKAGAPVPGPVQYVTGLPVIITIHPDGEVVVDVDLSEATDLEVEEYTDNLTAADLATVDRAVREGTYSYGIVRPLEVAQQAGVTQ